MEFNDDDDPSERSLKIKIINIYNAKLDERERRKKFILERGLLDYKKQQAIDRRRPKDEREVYQQMRMFARFHTAEEHEEFVQVREREREREKAIERKRESVYERHKAKQSHAVNDDFTLRPETATLNVAVTATFTNTFHRHHPFLPFVLSSFLLRAGSRARAPPPQAHYPAAGLAHARHPDPHGGRAVRTGEEEARTRKAAPPAGKILKYYEVLVSSSTTKYHRYLKYGH